MSSDVKRVPETSAVRWQTRMVARLCVAKKQPRNRYERQRWAQGGVLPVQDAAGAALPLAAEDEVVVRRWVQEQRGDMAQCDTAMNLLIHFDILFIVYVILITQSTI